MRILIAPALNEARALHHFHDEIVARLPAGTIDEVVIADGGSTDATAAIATAHGYRVVPPGPTSGLGKGGNLFHAVRAIAPATDDLVLMLDTDIHLAEPHRLAGLFELVDRGAILAKADFDRVDGAGRPNPLRGGRVTGLTARPLLRHVDDALATLGQPLSGQVALGGDALRRMPFLSHYALEIGMLLAAHRLGTVAEAPIGSLRNSRRPDGHLAGVAADVVDGFFLLHAGTQRSGSRVQLLGTGA